MWSRRDFLQGLGSAAVLPSLSWFRGSPLNAQEDTYTIAELEPFIRDHPPPYYWKYSKEVMFNLNALRRLVPQFARAYQETKRIAFGEGAYFYGYAWWRIAPKEERRKIARFLVNHADTAIKIHPNHPFGYCTKASAFGLEVLTLGVLESLHYLPHYLNLINEAIEKKPNYSFGLPLYLCGALYLKAPPFPMAIGSLEKAGEYFEKAYPYARGNSALYYVFFAEYTYLTTQSLEKAKKVKEQMLAEMKPPTQYEVYTLDIAITDMDALFQAIASQKYDKYLYSPLLEKARPAGITPERLGITL